MTVPLYEHVAWAAGLFEGEGCITHTGTNNRAVPALVMCSTDRDVVERFAMAIGSSIDKISTRPPAKAHHKTQYELRLYGRKKCHATLTAMWPWLSSRRRARAREIFNQPNEDFPNIDYLEYMSDRITIAHRPDMLLPARPTREQSEAWMADVIRSAVTAGIKAAQKKTVGDF